MKYLLYITKTNPIIENSHKTRFIQTFRRKNSYLNIILLHTLSNLYIQHMASVLVGNPIRSINIIQTN